jgi:hypothetical protein
MFHKHSLMYLLKLCYCFVKVCAVRTENQIQWYKVIYPLLLSSLLTMYMVVLV